LAAQRKTKEYLASHPVEPAPEDPFQVISVCSLLYANICKAGAQFYRTKWIGGVASTCCGWVAVCQCV